MRSRTPGPGDWFAFKLQNGQFAHGLVTHAHKKSYGLGYFYGPAFDAPLDMPDLPPYLSLPAVLVGKFGFLGFKTDDWLTLGRHASWDADEWPVPQFVRHEDLTGKTYMVHYGPDLGQPIEETLVPPEQAATGSQDGLMGHGFVVARMSRLLGASLP